MFEKWNGQIYVNGSAVPSDFKFEDVKGAVTIKLLPKTSKALPEANNKGTEVVQSDNDGEWKITVKAYMTKVATPEFDFMAKFNNNNPMPLRTMVGTVEKETAGMFYMHLHGMGEPVIRCLRCGKELTNPISRLYGIGPECMAKIGLVANIDDVEGIKEQLVNVEWSGWVIKSAITDREKV